MPLSSQQAGGIGEQICPFTTHPLIPAPPLRSPARSLRSHLLCSSLLWVILRTPGAHCPPRLIHLSRPSLQSHCWDWRLGSWQVPLLLQSSGPTVWDSVRGLTHEASRLSPLVVLLRTTVTLSLRPVKAGSNGRVATEMVRQANGVFGVET